MKVKELIEKLQKVDQEKEIILYKEEFEQGRIFAEVVDFENIIIVEEDEQVEIQHLYRDDT